MSLALLDLFSIAIFTAIGLSFIAIIMVCVWVGNRRYDGVTHWLFATFIILAYAYIMAEQLWLFKLDNYASDAWLNTMLPNILLCFGICQITHGFHRFLRIKQSLLWLYGAQLLLIGPLYSYGLIVETPILYSIIVLSLSVTISLLFNCAYLLSYQGKQYGMTRLICMLTCVLVLVLNVSRIGLLTGDPSLEHRIEFSTAIASINLLMSLSGFLLFDVLYTT